MKSLNVVFTGPEQAELRQEDVPDPAPREVTIQTVCSLISTGTESWCYRGRFDPGGHWANWVKYPFYPGYSNVGRIVRTGRDVTGFREADRVFSLSAHRQYANVQVESPSLVKLPDDASDEDATWSALAFVAQTGVRRSEHSMGDSAAVIGLGPLGQLVVQYLRVVGLKDVLAIDTVQPRLDMAAEHGATAAFRGSAADAADFVRDRTAGRLVDVVYDVTGHHAVLPDALKLARDFGKVVLIGDTPHPSKQHLTPDVLSRQVDILGTHNVKLPPRHAHWTARRQVLLFLEYLRRGQMRVADLITDRLRPDEAPQVYKMLQQDRGSTMGMLFDWRGLAVKTDSEAASSTSG